MFGIQPIHIVIVILVAFLIFGASRLPEIGRAMGKSISEFRKGTKEAADGFKQEIGQPDQTPGQPPAAQPPASGQPVRPTGNFCIHCGAPNLPEARFCANCGMKLPEKVA